MKRDLHARDRHSVATRNRFRSHHGCPERPAGSASYGGLHDDTRLATEIGTVVYRVVQEALTNVARYADAERVSLTLTATDRLISADIVDDGVGFDTSEQEAEASLGLRGMVERSGLLEGRIHIASERGCGTAVHLEVPVA